MPYPPPARPYPYLCPRPAPARPRHRDERRFLVENLQLLAKYRGCRVTLLSGDVHGKGARDWRAGGYTAWSSGAATQVESHVPYDLWQSLPHGPTISWPPPTLS